MATRTIKFPLKDALGVRCCFDLSYDCRTPPSTPTEPKFWLTGWTLWGIGISHEYVVEGGRIESAIPRDTQVTDCKEAKTYTLLVRYRVLHRIKLGFGFWAFGSGPAERVSASPGRLAQIDTPPVCCDPGYVDPYDKADVIPAQRMYGAAALPLVAVCGGGTAGILKGESWLGTLLLALGVVAVLVIVLSPIVVLIRIYWGTLSCRWSELTEHFRSKSVITKP